MNGRTDGWTDDVILFRAKPSEPRVTAKANRRCPMKIDSSRVNQSINSRKSARDEAAEEALFADIVAVAKIFTRYRGRNRFRGTIERRPA